MHEYENGIETVPRRGEMKGSLEYTRTRARWKVEPRHTHLAIATQVNERLERRERGDEVSDVVHFRGLERAVARVP